MARYAILVEFELPDDTDFTTVAGPYLTAMRGQMPDPSGHWTVTAFRNEAADLMTLARKATLDA